MNAVNAKIWQQKQKERRRNLQKIKAGEAAGFSRRKIYRALLLAALVLPAIAFGAYFYSNYAEEPALEFSGNIISVKAGGDFQAALERARPGDTISLQAGASFVGNFNLPMKSGGEFITVRTSAADAQFALAGTRIEPSKIAASILPKISSPNSEAAIIALKGAHHYRFVGVEFGATKTGERNVIQLGTSEERRVEELPHHIEFDRVFVHGDSALGQRRGIAANGRFVKITNSHIADIKRKGEESAAIGVWATDGPVEIVNNYVEAAAINILFGGAESFLKLTPTDCVVSGNHLNKQTKWRGEGWAVKNLFEIKHGRRIRVDGNLMTNNWGMAQDGSAVLFTTREDGGKQVIVEDIEFTNNVVRGSANALNVYGAEGRGGHRLTVRNNFFEDIDGGKWDGAGFFLKSTAWDGLVIENNTIINSGNISVAYEAPVKGFVFRDNIIFEKGYGFAGDSTTPGQAVIDRYFPNAAVGNNIIVGGSAANYRSRNFYPASVKQIGFVDADAGDYRLRGDSPYANKSSKGKAIGATVDARFAAGGRE